VLFCVVRAVQNDFVLFSVLPLRCSATLRAMSSMSTSNLDDRLGPVEPVLGDVLHHPVGHEVPDGLAGHDTRATVGGADGQGRNHL
jgi:hypothetical protein